MDRSIVQCKIIVVLTTPSVKMVFHTFQYSIIGGCVFLRITECQVTTTTTTTRQVYTNIAMIIQ